MAIARLAAKLQPGFIDRGLRPINPGLHPFDLFFSLPDARQVLVELAAIVRSETTFQRFRLRRQTVKNGPSLGVST